MSRIGRELDNGSISTSQSGSPHSTQDIRSSVPHQALLGRPRSLRGSLGALPPPGASQRSLAPMLSTSQHPPARLATSTKSEQRSNQDNLSVGLLSTIHHGQLYASADSDGLDLPHGHELSHYLSRSRIDRVVHQTSDRNTVSTFQGAHNFTISGNPRFITKQENVQINYGANGLDRLKPSVSFKALHDSSAQDPECGCHPGTRIDVLKRACKWIDDPNHSARILWLHGPAGIGKSAIAQTLAHSYSQDIVSATFFFFRTDPTRNDGKLLFPTLAWQLAHNIPDIQEYLSRILLKTPDLPAKAIKKQFKELVYEPFNKLGLLSQECLASKVIIVDAVDECSSRDLQRKIIEIMGKAVSEGQFPLRFLICSRPEAHIKDGIDQLQCAVFRINLAEVDSALHDIEKYLTSEFYRIAIEQRIDPTSWPGPDIIEQMVQKSSGQFIYASTIVKFVGDEFNSARSRLDIVVGLKPTGDQSPFAQLDILYMEILQRQADQKFMKDFLALFVLLTEHLVTSMHIHDLTLLLDVEMHELYRKLRGMHSVLNIGHRINVHHKSFIEFLQNPSRACQYGTTFRTASEIFLNHLTHVVVRKGANIVGQRDWILGSGSFHSHIKSIYRACRQWIHLPHEDLDGIIHQSLVLRDFILNLPKFGVPLNHGHFDHSGSSVCSSVDGFLLQASFSRYAYHIYTLSSHLEKQFQKQFPSSHKNDTGRNHLDNYLVPLITSLCDANAKSSMPIQGISSLLRCLLHFDPCETASKIQSRSDAQNLVDFIFKIVRQNDFLTQWSSDAVRSFFLLAIEIDARVPLIPWSLMVKRTEPLGNVKHFKPDVSFPLSCEMAFIWGNLRHNNIVPLLGIFEEQGGMVFLYQPPENGTIHEWRMSANLTSAVIRNCVLEVAKAIQYMHSARIVLALWTYEVYIDSNFHAKLLPAGCLRPSSRSHSDYERMLFAPTYEYNVLLFGRFLSSIYFGIDDPSCVDILEWHKKEWLLAQQCCAFNSRNRPSMIDVVKEIESWLLLDVSKAINSGRVYQSSLTTSKVEQ